MLFAATHVHMPKMMLPVTHTSFLKDTHTNFQINVGIGISYLLGIVQFVCKNQRWKHQIYLFLIWSYKFLFIHRNWYKILLVLTHVWMPKNDAASDKNQLFEGQSYKFRKVHRNWYKILWRHLEFVRQKMMLSATENSCLNYIHTNISINVGTGT